jgi:23S rRNA (pseudouridine1915-N3)-methyltransferase
MIRVLTVGRRTRGAWAELEDDYAKRISRLARFERATVTQSRARRAAERRRDEARALRGRIPDVRRAMVLDTSGKSLDSERFAARLSAWREAGEVCFVVGGPDGLDAGLIEEAGAVLALGPMTLPHDLALIVLLEQLYRALEAARNHPYAAH